MKYTSLIICVVFLPISLFANTVESENYILRDEQWRTTAQLTKSWEWTPALFFYDSKGVPRITIGLYGDGVPGIVLNDENWLATALLRMENNAWDPVLVLKEKWQDRYILDKNGVRMGSMGWWFSILQIFLLSLISGGIWGYIASILYRNKDTSVQNLFSSNSP